MPDTPIAPANPLPKRGTPEWKARRRKLKHEWRHLNLEHSKMTQRSYEYKRKYGITIDDYDQMFEDQNGDCCICEVNRAALHKDLAVDHCHITGKIRGLLCTPCNTALGLFKDNEFIINKALEYLKKARNDS